MEHKIFSSYTLGVNEPEGIVEKIVAVMGNIDQGGDRIWSGAFGKTIQERGLKIKQLDQHKSDSVRNVTGKTLEMRELIRAELPPDMIAKYPDATGGLWVKVQYILGTQAGRETFELVKAGAVDENSIGYDPVLADYENIDGPEGRKTIRNLRELKLYEYSDVIWGMNPATANLSAKDAKPEAKLEPEADESEDDFMGRCVPAMVEEGREQEQAVAMCASMFAQATEGEDEEKRKRRRRRIPAAGTGAVHAVVLDSDDAEHEAKAGRRVRKAKLEEARAAMGVLVDFLKWADYDEGEKEPPPEEDDDTDKKPDKAAGPDLHPRQKQAMIEKLKLELLEVKL